MSRIINLRLWLYKNRKCITNIFVGSIALVAILASQICIVETTSNSTPYSWCLQVYNLKPKKGNLCAFNFKGRRFIKYMVGTAGDEIKYVGKEVYVGTTKVGKAKKTKLLTPVTEGTILKGYVFMAGTHEDSLDSRYKEFGLIKVSDIRGRAIGLWRHKEDF